MRLKVLLVDDAASVRSHTKKILQANNIEDIDTAENGEVAIQMLKEATILPDLIITDLHMPKCDGLELIRQLANIHFAGYVVVMSGLDSRILQLAEQLAEDSSINLLAVMSKPFSDEHVQYCLDHIKPANDEPKQSVNLLSKRDVVEALASRRVMPYFQPKVSAQNGLLEGFEVLARITDPNGQVFRPCDFLETVDSHHLGKMLTLALLEFALPQFKKLQDLYPHPINLSFNLSPEELADRTYPDYLQEYCDTYQIPSDQLTVEITETQVLKEHKQLATLDRLRIHGFGVALDDFGTGYTNIGQLQKLPFTELKIDRELIAGIHKNKANQIILDAMIKLGELKGFSVTVEGVELEDEWQCLSRHFPSVFIQGYIISRPKPYSEISRWLKAWIRLEESDDKIA